METNTLPDAEASRRPWWLMLSFGIALLIFGGIATFLCKMMCAGLKHVLDDFSYMGGDFWVGLLLVVGSSLMLLALLTTVSSELRAVIRKSAAAAKHQAKLWQQARRVVLACMGFVILAPLLITVIPGRSFHGEFVLIGVFLTMCYLSSTHAKWSSLLHCREVGAKDPRE